MALSEYEGPSFGAKPDEKAARRAEEVRVLEVAKKGRLTAEFRDKVRTSAIADIPRWYSPWAHLAATTGIGLGVLVLSLVKIHDVHWTDWLVVPIVCVFANAFEWLAHKRFLHKRQKPFEVLYDKHTPMHHMIFVEDDMALRHVRELRLVLIPAAGVLGIVMATAPAALLVGHLWSPAAGWLFLLTASLFMVSYELLHLAYHAPAESAVGRLRFIAKLRAHHARHHDPRLMQRYNFNVTIPLFDWLMGTLAKAPREG